MRKRAYDVVFFLFVFLFACTSVKAFRTKNTGQVYKKERPLKAVSNANVSSGYSEDVPGKCSGTYASNTMYRFII